LKLVEAEGEADVAEAIQEAVTETALLVVTDPVERKQI